MKGFRHSASEMNGIEEPRARCGSGSSRPESSTPTAASSAGPAWPSARRTRIGVDERHRPARAGQDVHRLLAVLGLLPPRRAALRGALAAVLAPS